MKEETALRKEKEAVCCYVHVDMYMYTNMCVIFYVVPNVVKGSLHKYSAL